MNADPAETKVRENGDAGGVPAGASGKPVAVAAPGKPVAGRGRRAENPFGIVPIVILLVLVVGGLFVVFKLRDISNIQDCVWSGRKNCAAIDDPGR